jgi:hypothetical protein
MKQHRKELLKSRWKQEWGLTKSQQHQGCTFGLTSNIFLKLIIDDSDRMAASYIFQLRSGAHHPDYVLGLFQTTQGARHANKMCRTSYSITRRKSYERAIV